MSGMGQYWSAKKQLSGSNKVTLIWIAGQRGIPGNEEADKLAKEGTNGARSDQTLASPLLWAKKSSRVIGDRNT
jgi:ribonuclease HI